MWSCDADAAQPGDDYGFLIDDDPHVYPDPRSLWQPNGVHARSRIYDQNAFAWQCTHFQPPPLSSALIYELHIGTFTNEGTFDAAIGKLQHLFELGVTHVELMPVSAFAGHHGWGYDGVDLYAVYEPYGGPDGLKRFVDAAHQQGLAVLLDVVYNHFGPVGNYTGKYGDYVTESHHTPWGGAVNLDRAGSREVRRFFCDNALMWMREYRIDGLRLDAVHAYVDNSAVHLLEQLAMEKETLEAMLGRRLVLIAESDLNDPRIVTAPEAGGFGIDAQWSDDFHHALFSLLSREKESGYYSDFGSMEQLAKALEHTFVFDGEYSGYRQRPHGKSAAHLSQHRFLGYIQNHDQVGNRAVGERLQVSVGFDRARVAAALVLTAPFVPMIFQGEEWAASTPFQYFADHEDSEMARLVSAGRKREFEAFGWSPDEIPDPEKKETFLNSRLDWDEVSRDQHAVMLQWYRKLIQLRKSTSSLNDGHPGNTRVSFDSDAQWMAMMRGDITVLCNLAADPFAYKTSGEIEILLASSEAVFRDGALQIGPDSVAIFKQMPSAQSSGSVS
jgi:maltooligosyltrehalose trehalohydrolase